MNRPAALSLALAVAACASERIPAPSLALRPAELRGFEEPARPSAPAVAATDPALDAQLAGAGARLDAIGKGFDTDAARATRLVAAPGVRTVGGEAWLTAQGALARLDDWRSQLQALTVDLDTRSRERIAAAGAPYSALGALTTRATAEGERESAAIAALSASLPQP